MAEHEIEAPPAGEQIHLPGPSLQPVLLTAGITIALVGVTLSVILTVAGTILSLAVIVQWVRDTRHDVDELPLDH